MKILKLIVIFTAVVLTATLSQARDELFPFIATVTKNDVNVRSGQSVNFESLGRLALGSEVIVYDKKYSWYKIQLPPNFGLYISEEFVLVKDDNTGSVLGDRINVRARPSVQASVIAQVSKGDVLEVVDVKDGWCHIKPIKGVYGWVGEDLLKYHSKAVEAYIAKPVLSSDEKLALEKQKKEAQDQQRQLAMLKQQQEEQRRNISIKGKIQRTQAEDALKGMYQIITSDQLTYFIDEPESVFDRFLNFHVTIDAKIISFADANLPHSLIKVDKIQLVL